MSGTLAVVSQSGNSLSFFDLASGDRTAHMTGLIPEPHELVLDGKRNLLYCSHAYHHGHFWSHGENGHQISIIDPSGKKVVDIIDTKPARGPHGLVIDRERDFLWCSYEEHDESPGGGLIAIDLNTHKTIRRVGSSTKTHWFVVTPDGKKAFTCNKTADFISVLDLENEIMIGKIDTPGGTEECSISLDGKYAYFPTPSTQMGKMPDSAEILVIDTATDEVVDRIALSAGPQATHVASDGNIMVGEYRFVDGKPGDGRLSIYEGQSHKLVGTADIGKMPLTIRSSPDGKFGFAANIFAGTVSVTEMLSMETLRTIVVDTERSSASNLCQGAHGMVYFPSST